MVRREKIMDTLIIALASIMGTVLAAVIPLLIKYLDKISFNHKVNEEKLIRKVLPTAAKANSVA